MMKLTSRCALAAGLMSLCLAVSAQDLRISMYTDISGLDPRDTSDTPSYAVQSGIFERLFQFDENMKLIPWLATGYSSNSDATEFELTLREGVTFQDGTEFDARAVKINLEQLADQSRGLKRNSLYNMIKTVSVTGANTVKVSLNRPFGAFINTLAHPSAVMFSARALEQYPDKAQLRLHPVGTGPFIFSQWQPGKQVKMVKYDNYWRKGWPKVDSVTFYPSPEDTTRVATLKSGQVDAIYPLPADLAATVQSDARLDIQRNPGIMFYYLAINNLHSPLNDVRVRQALNYAINRDVWLKVSYAGMGSAADSVMSPNVQFHAPQQTPNYNWAPEQAKDLLKQAGHSSLNLKLWTPNDTPSVRSGQFFKQQLALIGVNVTVTPMDSGTRNGKLFGVTDPAKAEYDLYYSGWSPSTGDADWALRPLYASESWVPAAYNVPYYSNSLADEQIKNGLSSADPEIRAAAYSKAQQIIWRDAPAIFLGTPDTLVGKVKNLSGVYMMADYSLVFNQAEFN